MSGPASLVLTVFNIALIGFVLSSSIEKDFRVIDTIIGARTGNRIDSVWEVIPPYFWAVVAASLVLLWRMIHQASLSASFKILSIISMGSIFYLLPAIVYKYGNDVDNFVHAAFQANL